MTKRKSFERYNVLKITGIIFVMVAVLWCMIGIKVNAAERAENNKTEYRLQELQFKSEIRESLEELGYDNCGITMTKIMDTEGGRKYTVLVHHQYLEAENKEKVDAVYEKLMNLDMEGENITVNYTIF